MRERNKERKKRKNEVWERERREEYLSKWSGVRKMEKLYFFSFFHPSLTHCFFLSFSLSFFLSFFPLFYLKKERNCTVKEIVKRTRQYDWNNRKSNVDSNENKCIDFFQNAILRNGIPIQVLLQMLWLHTNIYWGEIFRGGGDEDGEDGEKEEEERWGERRRRKMERLSVVGKGGTNNSERGERIKLIRFGWIILSNEWVTHYFFLSVSSFFLLIITPPIFIFFFFPNSFFLILLLTVSESCLIRSFSQSEKVW